MKLPKHILAALGRPRVTCPICKRSVDVTASNTLAQHKRYGASSYGGYRCQGTATTAPDGAALEWLRREMASQKARAESFRADAERATKNAEPCDAMAAELEKIVARESGKGAGT